MSWAALWWGRACQALTWQPGVARPAAESLPKPLGGSSTTDQAAFSSSTAQRGIRKGPHHTALLTPRTRRRDLVRGPGEAETKPLPLHHAARQGHIHPRSCARYGTLVLPPYEQRGWLTLQTPARLCWELSFCPTARKGPGPGQEPAAAPRCRQDLL